MKPSRLCLAVVRQYEGFSEKPYLCPAGVPTIGYGATRYEDGRRVQMTDPPIDKARAEAMLQAMLEGFAAEVERCLGPTTVAQHEFDALVSFAYNVGAVALAGSTLMRKLRAGDRAGAAEEFLRWDKAGGQTLLGLTARRKKERALFLGQVA